MAGGPGSQVATLLEEAFTYDGLNRLTAATLTDTTTLQTIGTPTTYTYDSLGNLTTKSVRATGDGEGARASPSWSICE